MARVLGTVVGSDRPAVDTVASVLAPQRLLLVLDNCEHLTDAVAEFVDTVCAAAPGLRVLVTSQETLKSADEHVYRLGALAVPARDAAADAPHAGAVEMFAARAEAVDPRFTLTPDNLPAVADICRRLDGIPLAIELAAARIPLLGVEGVRARLDDRFSVLTAGSRVVLRRHQTLRATLEWSHGLLTPDEQTVFRRLGVFAGSFTLEAAQHVVRDAHIDEWAALDHLGALVDKSLVLAEGDPVPRYRLLETTRAYALERLGDAGETASSMRLHAEALLQSCRPSGSVGPVAAAEIDNLRAALAWTATTEGCNELAVSLAAHSLRVWHATCQLHEGLEHALSLKGRLSDDLPPALVARFWLTVAELGQYTTRRESYDAARRAVELCRALDDPPLLFAALIQQAVQGIRFGTIEDMGRAIAEAEGLIRPDWPAERHSRLEFARARHFGRQGRMEESLAAAERQAAINAQAGPEAGMHYAMSNVVSALNVLGRNEEALTRARASIARLDAIGGTAGAGHLWVGVMHAELLLGHVPAALEAGRTGVCTVAARRRRVARVLGPRAVRSNAGPACRCGTNRRLRRWCPRARGRPAGHVRVRRARAAHGRFGIGSVCRRPGAATCGGRGDARGRRGQAGTGSRRLVARGARRRIPFEPKHLEYRRTCAIGVNLEVAARPAIAVAQATPRRAGVLGWSGMRTIHTSRPAQSWRLGWRSSIWSDISTSPCVSMISGRASTASGNHRSGLGLAALMSAAKRWMASESKPRPPVATSLRPKSTCAAPLSAATRRRGANAARAIHARCFVGRSVARPTAVAA